MPDDNPAALLDAGFRYAMSLLHDRSAAEDLVQDAWAALLAAGGPRDRRYLFRTVRNRWIDGWRRSNVVGFEPLTDPEAHAGRGLAPDAHVDRPALDRALGTLEPAHREALFLTAVEGWTTAEVAKHLGVPRGTVLSWLHRARATLRDQLTTASQEALG